MNQYIVNIFSLQKYPVKVVADNKEDAIDFVKEIYLKTDLIDLSKGDKEAIFIEAELYNKQMNNQDIVKDTTENSDKDRIEMSSNIDLDDDELRVRKVYHQTTDQIHYETICPICHKVVNIDKLMEEILG